jgi:hypothetical protein
MLQRKGRQLFFDNILHSVLQKRDIPRRNRVLEHILAFPLNKIIHVKTIGAILKCVKKIMFYKKAEEEQEIVKVRVLVFGYNRSRSSVLS